jgi:hypothetical protein
MFVIGVISDHAHIGRLRTPGYVLTNIAKPYQTHRSTG